MAYIDIKGLGKSYKDNLNLYADKIVLSDVNLEIEEGEFITFFGPNGCGKTTLLKIMCGILNFDKGFVSVNSKKPEQVNRGIVFQNYSEALMPWLTCKQNILFPFRLNSRRMKLDEGIGRLENLIRHLDIDLPMDQYPYQMSGGQQQIATILRNLVIKPDVLFFDEPFSSLDFQTRELMQDIILTIWELEHPTIVFVSHDLDEAIYLADKVVLLSNLPTRIKSVLKVPFTRPRKRVLLGSKDYFNFKQLCIEEIQYFYEAL